MTIPKPSLDVYKESFREYLVPCAISRSNRILRHFIRETNVVQNDTELEPLLELLHKPLPISFRLNLHRRDAAKYPVPVKTQLATKCQFPSHEFFHDEIPVNPPKPIPWYPLEHVAWQMDCGRVALSKCGTSRWYIVRLSTLVMLFFSCHVHEPAPKHDLVRAFHSFLLAQTDRGNIERQEAVSMLPVLFLNVQRCHRVFDMCASPGSKTTQILDLLLSSQDPTSEEPSGLVIANDLNKKRAYMLVHRLSRNTLRRAVVTCVAGDTFPGLYDAATKTLQSTNVFDRVLCDVPCSGDGTLRKNQALWKDWHIGQGLTLHPMQLSLALRGAALLKVGGILVYATCSFNCVENEAVVAELLRRAGGSLVLLDVSKKLPELVTRPGRSTWRVGWRSKSKSCHKGHLFKKDDGSDKNKVSPSVHQWFDRYDTLPQDLRGKRVARSMFPPESVIAQELQKTLRIVPIDQDSGGFFIAVLHKVANLPGEKGQQEGLPPLKEDQLTPPPHYICKLCGKGGHFLKTCDHFVPDSEYVAPKMSLKPQKKRRRSSELSDPESEAKKKETQEKRETPYRPIGDDVWRRLRDFYGLEDTALKFRYAKSGLKRLLGIQERLWCRSDTAATVNYVDKEISDACLGGDALNIVNTGLKVFTKVTESGNVFYRPSEESLGFMDDFFTKRRLDVSVADFSSLLKSSKQHVTFDTVSSDVQAALAALPIGPAVVWVRNHDHVRMNIWIGKGSILPRVSNALCLELEDALQELNGAPSW
ncbi:hypothetical protein PsorP6_016169 [Peronosclerospora sorghi]|uniref:Uncharacterized protein n=1 Tax=Peronosclerospora sorghi TaxID=230839 RepID=A0ACC0VQ09_9STRA|nr:hypothetical protein PsorP6_016169 [Peronosclerospora sorghi]